MLHSSGLTNLPVIVLTPCMLPCFMEAWTPLHPSSCAVESGADIVILADPLSPVVNPPWITLVCPEHPTGA